MHGQHDNAQRGSTYNCSGITCNNMAGKHPGDMMPPVLEQMTLAHCSCILHPILSKRNKLNQQESFSESKSFFCACRLQAPSVSDYYGASPDTAVNSLAHFGNVLPEAFPHLQCLCDKSLLCFGNRQRLCACVCSLYAFA